ncbi:hypothetical protein GOODEAATRI_015347 [Goodea atripinnis]|uniref:Uncharacterized protein n=1 Tax=Goodea atripinnis TaxID=208336 RepID=A0ABV0NY64_9TELE
MTLVSMEGVVIAMTRVTKYTQGARFLCTDDDCPGSTDELCHSMTIGRLYRVVGIPSLVYQWPSITWSVEANSVQPWELERCHKASPRCLELSDCMASSPWRFPAIVAHCFGSDLTPPGSYNTLKLCLLLSLVQTRTDANEAFHNLDLLAVTDDTLVLDRLMTYSLSLACRGVRHQAFGEMFACLSRDEHGAGTANIHAGSALLASGGICMLGDLGFYKKDKLDYIQTKVLEEDAVIAVLLCENSVTLKHGASALVVPPDAVFPCDLGDVDGLRRRDAALDELHQNILRFVYTFAPGANAYITEE